MVISYISYMTNMKNTKNTVFILMSVLYFEK